MSSIARIFGAPVMLPPGKAAASRSKASASGRSWPGHRGDEVLDGGRALEAQQPGHAHRAGLADPPEVVAQHVHDHHVLGLVLGAREQLAGERAILLAGPAARPGALDRVRGRRGRSRRRRGTAPARPTAGRGACRWRARGRCRGSRRTGPGRRSGGGGRRATGRRRTGPRGAASGWPGRCRRGAMAVAHGLDVPDPGVVRRQRDERRRDGGRRTAAIGGRPRASESRRSRTAAIRRAQPRGIAIDRPRRQPRRARCAGPRRAPSRGARAGASAGAGPRARSTGSRSNRRPRS